MLKKLKYDVRAKKKSFFSNFRKRHARDAYVILMILPVHPILRPYTSFFCVGYRWTLCKFQDLNRHYADRYLLLQIVRGGRRLYHCFISNAKGGQKSLPCEWDVSALKFYVK